MTRNKQVATFFRFEDIAKKVEIAAEQCSFSIAIVQVLDFYIGTLNAK